VYCTLHDLLSESSCCFGAPAWLSVLRVPLCVSVCMGLQSQPLKNYATDGLRVGCNNSQQQEGATVHVHYNTAVPLTQLIFSMGHTTSTEATCMQAHQHTEGMSCQTVEGQGALLRQRACPHGMQ
jgi:hypothetical protein